jgi:hypothetical protein
MNNRSGIALYELRSMRRHGHCGLGTVHVWGSPLETFFSARVSLNKEREVIARQERSVLRHPGEREVRAEKHRDSK